MSLATADQLLLPRDPTATMEAATKQYVDNGLAGNATAAQGVKADNAVQPGSNPDFGNVTISCAGSSGYIFSDTNDSSKVWQWIALGGNGGLWNNSFGFIVTFAYTTGAATFNGAISSPSVTDTSDARLKTNVRREKHRYRGIRRVVEMVLYDRTNGLSNDEPGVIAQELQKAGCHADDFVGKTSDGTLTVHYGKLALACALDPERWT